MQLGWYNFKKFDHREYERNHKLDNGDMNWIIPGKILAFSSPNDRSSDGLSVKDFVPKFEKLGINTVIRLNECLYDESILMDAGIRVYNQEYQDGSCPNDYVIRTFVETCEVELCMGNGVAVHCRAGLGRTGSLISCYIMHKYKFSAKALIGWMRIARPGSIIGV